MSDVVAGTSGVEPVAPPTAGALLRQAREASGLHIAALAVSLKVPVRKLEALEADRFEDLPDAVFARALASSVCRALKIDAAPVLALLPSGARTRIVSQVESGINTPFRAPGDGPAPSPLEQLSRPAILAVIALLLAALVILLLPAAQSPASAPVAMPAEAPVPPPVQNVAAGAETVSPSEASTGAAAVTSSGGPGVSPAGAVVTAPSPANPPSASSANPSVSTAVAAAAVSPRPAVPSAVSPRPSAAPGTPVAAESANGIVVFAATAETWVEVVDARGEVALRRILRAGETVGASGSLPLSVVVGRADAARVQVRGKAFDLNPLARDNVARFEVK